MLSWIALLALLAALFAVEDLRAADRGTLRIGGTGGALGAMRELAAAFETQHPGVTVIIVQRLGTKGGMNAVLKGALDIGLAGRHLGQQEFGRGLREVGYAKSPFVFVAQGSAARAGMTLATIAAIYRDDLRSWPDGTPLRLILRPPDDGDMLLLKAISPALNDAVSRAEARPGMLVAKDDQENCDLLEKVPGAFGAATLTQLVAERRTLAVLPLDGIAPDLDAMAAGRYPYAKSFVMVTVREPAPLAAEFIRFVTSPGGAAILARNGSLPAGAP